MNSRPRAGVVSIALAAAACRAAPGPPPSARQASAAPAATTATVPHGDHNPHHGGIVMMKGDLHYEVVLDPTGREHRLFFTDATREDLPAALASTVGLTVHRPGAADEPIAMKIDESGESWVGSGRPVADPPKAGARVAFTIANEPYWIDVPFAAPKEDPRPPSK